MRATDMTVGKPGRLILSFALPTMAGNVCQQLYTIVDGAFVGRFAGINALAALGAADWLSWMLLGVIVGYTQGFSILISQRFGAHNPLALRKAVGQSIFLTALITLGLMAGSQLLIGPFLRVLNTPEEIFPQAALYLRILMAALPIFSAYNMQAGILRALGDSRTPLMAVLIASLSNIALDALFVIYFRWGVAGAAAATVIAQVCSALICFRALVHLPMVHPGKRDFSWDRGEVRRLMSLGTPTAAQNVVIGLGGLAVQRVVNGYGSAVLAGFTATNKLYGLMEMAGISYGSALAAYTGQNYGAGSRQRIRSGVRFGAVMGVATSLFIAVLLFLFGRSVLSVFVDPLAPLKEQVLDVGVRYLNIMLAGLFILYLLYVYRSALQGMGDTVTPMLSGLVELVIRVSVAMLLPAVLGQDGIYLAEPAAWLGAEVLLMAKCYITMSKLRFEEEG